MRPRIGSKSIYDLKRKDIVEMMDAIEDADKAVTADRVLAYVRKAFNWYAARDDEFTPPIVRGMARTKPSERARTRALADDEICSLWAALESTDSPEPFRAMVRVLLLTAQRKNEIGLMRAEEIDGDTLVIPAERYKTGVPNAVPLTAEARRWIGDRKAGFMFSSTDGKKPFNGYSKAKAQLDAVIAKQRKAAKLKPMPRMAAARSAPHGAFPHVPGRCFQRHCRDGLRPQAEWCARRVRPAFLRCGEAGRA